MATLGINRVTLYIQNCAIAKEGSGKGCLTSCGDPPVGSISQERHHQTGDAAHTVHETRKCSTLHSTVKVTNYSRMTPYTILLST